MYWEVFSQTPVSCNISKLSTMPIKETHLLDKTELLRRAKDLSRENLKFIFSIAKAISLSAATIVFFNILIDKGISNSHMSWLDFSFRISLWLISCLGMLVTYDGAMLGTLFLSHIPRGKETIYTFSLAAIEFLLFAILSPNFFLEYNDINTFYGFKIINIWFLFWGLYCLCSNLIIRNALKNIREQNFLGLKVINLVSKYKKMMRREVRASFCVGLLSILIFGWFILSFILSCSFAYYQYFQFIPLFIFISAMIFAFKDQHNQRVIIEEIIQNI